jgi:hypothetical protein
MDLLQNLLGGGQQRQEFQEFVGRYDRGAPYDGISDQEAMQRYRQVAQQLPPDVYQQSAQDAFAQLTPQQRMQLGRYLQQQTRQQNMNFPDLNQDGIDDRLQDPRFLAQVTGRIQQQQPGLLEQMLGAAMGGAGIGQQMGGGGIGHQMASGMGQQMGGGALDNPIAKAALAGIAAMAVKRMMSGR